MTRSVAVDVGGTFIDLVAVDRASGTVSIEKQPATPDRLADELLEGFGRLPGSPADVVRMLHGSTVAINALIQRRGGRVGLITTAGFRDVIELGRGNRPDIYDWLYVPPVPLVEPALRREVTERLGPGGEEILPLDVDAVLREAGELVALGVDAIAICFLHAYADPKHERRAGAVIAERHPAIRLTLSSDVASEWHEYERTSTAAINAFLQPVVGRYLGDLETRLSAAGVVVPMEVMQSNGGVMTTVRARELPVRTLASGPAGGVIGVEALAGALGHANAICADVGGTTFDVAIIEDGRVLERTETDVGGLPILAPTIDVVSIGAGGGSVAWFDDAGALRVGPLSAGARPGPACFGFGGVEPTVTDAHVVLGWLDPETFLGSRMQLDPAAAERAIAERVGVPLGLTTEAAADGILTIAENAMANAISSMTVERGSDPREFVLYAYGGGGGLFAAAVASELEIPTVVVPRSPATFSAWGILAADQREDATSTKVETLDAGAMGRSLAEMEALRAELIARFAERGISERDVRIHRLADLRFAGQEHTVGVSLDPEWGTEDAGRLAERFVELHRRLYGHGDPAAEVEVVTLRCRAVVPAEPARWPAWSVRDPAEPAAERSVFFRSAGGWVPTPVYERDALALDQVVRGPAIVHEWTSTLVVPPGWTVTTDEIGDLLMERSR